jgi:multiple sugar transport system substrate-binding protein
VRALAAAARRLAAQAAPIAIAWHTQPLEGFESHPIAERCAEYDLIVLDHPHIGQAVADGCLYALDELFDEADLRAWARESVGPSFESYRFADRHWALPLDAATQVLARRPDLLDVTPPTWDDVLALPAGVGLAVPMAGPHPVLTWFALATAFGEPPALADAGTLVGRSVGERALDVLARLRARTPAHLRALNPIALLDRMSSADDIALCPLVYGYVNYARADGGRRPVAFHDAPRAAAGGRPGSTLGGTGLGVSRRCRITPALVAHLRWLLGREAQVEFIPSHDGQPSRREAWRDPGVNARWGGFYQQTLATIECAYVRPRHRGCIEFQTAAAQLLREGLDAGTPHRRVLDDLQSRYAASRGREGGRQDGPWQTM